jgi:hypothetical protein
MPEFDKEEYWKNRKSGKRGQGDKEKPVFAGIEGTYWARTKMGLIKVGREVARRMGVKDAKV